MNNDIVWHNASTGETQIWLMDNHKIVGRATVVSGELGNPSFGQPMFVGLPWRIVGSGDFNGNGNADILWHNESSNETQIWLMDRHKVAGRATVISGEPGFPNFGQPAFVGLPWRIVGTGDFNGDGKADILWHNESTNETQIWLMDQHKLVGRATVISGEQGFQNFGQPVFVGLPWKIVGVGDFNGNGTADILWHNDSTNETQLWLMDQHKVVGRATVISGEQGFLNFGQPALIGPPWRIVGAGDFNGNGTADILWHNESTNETQMWLMDQHRVVGRATVISGEPGFPNFGQPAFVGLPWSIVGSGMFTFREVAEQKLRELYLHSGAHRGPLGFPLSDVQFRGFNAEQRFAGGRIQFQDRTPTPKGVATTSVRVRFVGFHCNQESDHDQLSDTDEPYFIIGIAASNRSHTVRFGPYENIATGTNRFEAALLADPFSGAAFVPPIVIGVVANEHDEGTPEEAEEKVRNIFKGIEEKFEQALATFGATTGGSHVLPEWARDILIGWVPEGIAAVFGLGDDTIGSVPLVMFDFNPGLDKWTTPPNIGMHGQNPYNTAITIDGGGEGKYELRFNVEIVNIDMPVS